MAIKRPCPAATNNESDDSGAVILTVRNAGLDHRWEDHPSYTLYKC